MSYGYGGRQNPYAQQDAPAGSYAPPQQSYGSPQQNYGGGFASGGGYGDNVEMTPLAQAAAPAGATANPLDEIRDVGNGVNAIDQNLEQLRMLQDRALNETDTGSSTSRQLDQLTAETMASYRGLVQRLRELKGNPQAQSYRGQIDRLDRQLKDRIQQYQQLEASHRHKMQEQMKRQYLIVRPDAPESEVRAAVDDMSAGGGGQVFQQAMMQSNRQGQARAVLNEVQNRHKELLKIEQQMNELTALIVDLDTIIVQQAPMVEQIDEHVEKTQEDLKQANVELDTAVNTVRSTRKKKWICCGIVTAIILIIVIAVVVYFVLKNQNASNNTTTTTAKRSLADLVAERSLSDAYAQSKAVARSIAGRIVLPGEFREVNAGRTATLPVAVPN